MRARGLLAIIPLLACSSSTSSPASEEPDPPEESSFTSCTADCEVATLMAVFGAETAAFDRAYFGLGASGDIYVETYAGGSEECPTEESPTPEVTLIISSLDRTDGPGGQADFGATLLDFTGKLLPLTPVAETTATSMMWEAADYDGFVAFDLDASFSGGSVEGHIYATYCSSLDE